MLAIYIDITSIPKPSLPQLTSLIRLKLLPRASLLALLSAFDLPYPQLSDLFYDLLTDLLDASTTEYLSFVSSPLLLTFIKHKLGEELVGDHQLIRQVDKEVFKRLRGRLPELSQYIFEAKARHVEKVTMEEASVVHEIMQERDSPVS